MELERAKWSENKKKEMSGVDTNEKPVSKMKLVKFFLITVCWLCAYFIKEIYEYLSLIQQVKKYEEGLPPYILKMIFNIHDVIWNPLIFYWTLLLFFRLSD